MFERFTAEARRVVVIAQEEARDARARRIGPQHMLLGILQVDGPGGRALHTAGVQERRLRAEMLAVGGDPGDPLDVDALSALGIDLRAVREKVEATFGSGALDSARERPWQGGHIPFADAGKQALERALRAAVRRGDRSLDSGHLLLGVLAVGDGRVAEVLRRLEVDPEDLRSRVDSSDAA